jgi:succinoglycan biosynthesis transport protein ExoP
MSELAALVDEEEARPGLLAHLPVILWQRRWLVIFPFVLLSAAGVIAAFLLPASFRSSAVLLVESQQLPAELVGSPTTSLIDKRIAKIRQQILSRPDLVDLIQTNNLYAQERESQPLSTLITKMRDATVISAVNADIAQDNKGSNTIAFSLTFDYPDAQKAQIVAQGFVDRLLKLDSTQTAEQAVNTVNFLQDQATALSGQIAEIEQKIEAIKGANGSALSSAGMMMMPSGGGGYESQIAGLQRENAQLSAQSSLISSAATRDPTVVAAEAQLAGARAVYSDNHPDVRFAEQRLAEAKRLAAKNTLPATNAAAIRSQIASNNAMIASLNQTRMSEQSRASAVVSAQSRAPLVLEQVAQLESKANGLRTNYQVVATNLMNARTSAKMGAEQKGERLSVIDPPVVADKPNWPNRPLLIGGGIVVGAGLGFALALLFELIQRPVRGVEAVRQLTGSAPLVVVPTLKRSEATRGWRLLTFWRHRQSALH